MPKKSNNPRARNPKISELNRFEIDIKTRFSSTKYVIQADTREEAIKRANKIHQKLEKNDL